jgi:hypothetical protein
LEQLRRRLKEESQARAKAEERVIEVDIHGNVLCQMISNLF